MQDSMGFLVCSGSLRAGSDTGSRLSFALKE